MTEFTFIEDDQDYECPNPSESSIIMFQVEYVDGKTYGVMDYTYEGGAASYENEFGVGIDYVVKGLICVEDIELIEDEWYVIEGFTSHFTQDYYGEVDCRHEYGRVRRATIYDNLYFGV